ncbi:MAG: hypothetical protein ACYDBV_04740 [Nitrospiria bacterium]
MNIFSGYFSQGQRGERIKERWLKTFTEIISKLPVSPDELALYKRFVTIEWVEKIYSYLEEGSRKSKIRISSNPTFIVIDQKRFYGFQYFIHEAIEISLLDKKMEKPESHARALIMEYELLEQLADSFGCRASAGTLFHVHPCFSGDERKDTKLNDEKILLETLRKTFTAVPSEIKNAEEFFEKVEKL